MPVVNNQVSILSWPKGPAKLEHAFENPCPVFIAFEKTPANLLVASPPNQSLNVEMAMNVIARETIPVCIKICEPICVKSDYVIGIDIFDRPVAAITVKGLTRLFNCNAEKEPDL